MNLRWVIQNNLGSSQEIQALIDACTKLGAEVCPVRVLPFSEDLPKVGTDKPAIFYGSARFVAQAKASKRWSPCAWFDEEVFRYSQWSAHYTGHLLNEGLKVQALREAVRNTPFAPDALVFVRPDGDLKSFGGQVMRMQELTQWCNKLEQLDDAAQLHAGTPVIVGHTQQIHHEWRTFMVDGKVCTGSHYRADGRLDIHPEIPQKVKDFAQHIASLWQPARVFTLDICATANKLAVIEINGFNSTGFYASDIAAIAQAASQVALDQT